MDGGQFVSTTRRDGTPKRLDGWTSLVVALSICLTALAIYLAGSYVAIASYMLG